MCNRRKARNDEEEKGKWYLEKKECWKKKKTIYKRKEKRLGFNSERIKTNEIHDDW